MTTAQNDRLKGPDLGNGVTTVFAYDFLIKAASEIRVTLRSSAAVDTVQTYATHYTLSGIDSPSGGNVTFLTAPPSGSKVIIEGVTPRSQDTAYSANDRFPSESHEGTVDRLMRIEQEQDNVLARTLRLPIGLTAPVMTVGEDGELLGWSDGVITNQTPATLGSDVSLGSGWIADLARAASNAYVVETVAALQAATWSLADAPPVVHTRGYSIVNDGGAATYDLDEDDASSVDDGALVITTATAGTALRYLLRVGTKFDARMAGVKGDGLTASATANTTALNALLANTAINRICLPRGEVRHYALTANRSNLILEGHGAGTLMNYAALTGDALTCGDGVTEIGGIVLRDFDMWAIAAKSAGWAIKFRKVVRSSIFVNPSSLSRVAANANLSNQFNGVWIDGYDRVKFEGEITNTQTNIRWNGKTGQTYGAEGKITANAVILGGVVANVHLAGAANVYSKGEVGLGKVGILCDKTETAETNRELFVRGEIDGCTEQAILVKADALAVLDAQAAWIATNGLAANGKFAVEFEASVAGTPVLTSAKLNGARIYNNANGGIKVASCNLLNVEGVTFELNGSGANGGVDLHIAGANAYNVRGTGMISRGTGNGTLGVCLKVDAGADFFSFDNWAMQGFGTVAVNNGTTLNGTTRIIQNCPGYAASLRGHTVIANKNNVDQSGIANAAFTKITFGTELDDPAGVFAGSTLTATEGRWRITVCCGLNTTPTGVCLLALYKNGVRFLDGPTLQTAVAAQGLSGNWLVNAAAGDTFEVYAYLTTGGTSTIEGDINTTYFNAEKVA